MLGKGLLVNFRNTEEMSSKLNGREKERIKARCEIVNMSTITSWIITG